MPRSEAQLVSEHAVDGGMRGLVVPESRARRASFDELVGWLRVERRDHLREQLAKLDAARRVLRHP